MDNNISNQRNNTVLRDLIGGDNIQYIFQETKEINPLKKVPKDNYASTFKDSQLAGRNEELDNILSKLQQKNGPIYLNGIGGIGKTTLAKAYCTREKDKYDYIFWIESNSDDIRIDILNYPIFSLKVDRDNYDVSQEYNNFIKKSKAINKKKTLLVIDNIQTEDQISKIEKFISNLGWNVIVTTRTNIKDNEIEKRTLNIKELNEKACYELFYQHFTGSKNDPNDIDNLKEIFQILDYHTYLICLLSKVAHKADFSIQKLLLLLKEKEGLRNKKFRKKIYDKKREKYDFLTDHIYSMFSFDTITFEEKTILQFFSILPDTFFSKRDLRQLLLIPQYSENDIDNALESLSSKGWLMQEFDSKNEECNFKCHNLIQVVIKENKELSPNINNYSVFIKNMTGFLYFDDGEEYYHLIPYIDSVSSILKQITENNVLTFNLKKNYVKLLNSSSMLPTEASKYSEFLMNNYKNTFNRFLKGREWYSRLLDVHILYIKCYRNFTKEGGKHKRTHELLENAYNIAKKKLNKNDSTFISIENQMGISLRQNGKLDESIALLEKLRIKLISLRENRKLGEPIPLIEKLKNKLIFLISNESNNLNNNLENQYLDVLGALDMSYSNLARKNKNRGLVPEMINAYKEALKVRMESVEIGEKKYGKEHTTMTVSYNNLAIAYLYLYAAGEKKEEYLNEAENLLKNSLNFRIIHFGEESKSVAIALNSIAQLYQLKEDFYNALKSAYRSLEIKKTILMNDKHSSLLYSYRRLAEIHFSKWERFNSLEDLLESRTHIREAIEIAEHEFDGDKENYLYEDLLCFEKRINNAMKTYKTSFI